MQPVHQSPADLQLNIIAGNLDAPLTRLKSNVHKLGLWTFTFHIIGESHLVTIERENQPLLNELLACVDFSPEAALHHHRFGDLEKHHYQGAGYAIGVRFEDTAGDHPRFDEKSLEVAFPPIHGQTPVTQIFWTPIGTTMMRWRTLHMYPHQGGAVYVRTLSYFDTVHYNRDINSNPR